MCRESGAHSYAGPRLCLDEVLVLVVLVVLAVLGLLQVHQQQECNLLQHSAHAYFFASSWPAKESHSILVKQNQSGTHSLQRLARTGTYLLQH